MLIQFLTGKLYGQGYTHDDSTSLGLTPFIGTYRSATPYPHQIQMDMNTDASQWAFLGWMNAMCLPVL